MPYFIGGSFKGETNNPFQVDCKTREEARTIAEVLYLTNKDRHYFPKRPKIDGEGVVHYSYIDTIKALLCIYEQKMLKLNRILSEHEVKSDD